MSFDETIKPIVEKLKNRIPLPPLEPKKIWDPELSKTINGFDIKESTRAALLLWNDDLEGAHLLAQQVHNSTGSLIHGIMHRRQPDYSNSKYWFRRVGSHPIFINLIQEFSGWEPLEFIDRCQQASLNKDSKALEALQAVQARELELIAHYCLEMKA